MNWLSKAVFSFLLFTSLSLCAEEKKSHEIAIEIKIDCPMSEELKEFMKSIPAPDSQSANYEEWKSSFIHNMTHLIRLIESNKITNSGWSVKTDDQLHQLMNEN